MRRTTVTRFLALSLALSLILSPYPAFALRQTGLEESDQIKGQLVDALTNSAPSSSTTVSHTLATISAGMEEKSLREIIQEELTLVRPQLTEKLTERHWEVLERTETLGEVKRTIRGQVEKRKLDSTAGVILGAVQRAKTRWRQQEEAKRNILLKKQTREQRLEGETQPSQPLPKTQQVMAAAVELAAQYQDLLAKILTEKDETAAKSLALDRLDKWIHSAEEVLPTIELVPDDKGLVFEVPSRLRQVKKTVAYTQDRQQWEDRIINLDKFLNSRLFLPYGGVWVFLRIEGGRHELIFGPPAAWWRIQAGGKEILLVVWPEGLTTAYSHVKGVLILDVGEIHQTVQNGIRWWKKAGHPIGSVSAFYQRYLRELLHEELGHAVDAVVFEEFGEGEEAVRQAVIPNSDLESFIRQDPPDNIENDIPEVAAYFRHLIFADSPRGMLEATTAVLEAAVNPSDRLHHWAGRFVRQQVMKALTVDSAAGEAEVDLFVKVKTMPVAEIRRKVRDRMSTNLNLPTEGGIFPHLSEDGRILSEHPAIVQMRDTCFNLMEPMIRAGAEEVFEPLLAQIEQSYRDENVQGLISLIRSRLQPFPPEAMTFLGNLRQVAYARERLRVAIFEKSDAGTVADRLEQLRWQLVIAERKSYLPAPYIPGTNIGVIWDFFDGLSDEEKTRDLRFSSEAIHFLRGVHPETYDKVLRVTKLIEFKPEKDVGGFTYDYGGSVYISPEFPVAELGQTTINRTLIYHTTHAN